MSCPNSKCNNQHHDGVLTRFYSLVPLNKAHTISRELRFQSSSLMALQKAAKAFLIMKFESECFLNHTVSSL